MSYLYGYLGIGAVMLAIIFVSHQLTKSPSEDAIRGILEGLEPRRDRWTRKLLNNVIVPMLAVLTILMVWPLAIYWKAKEIIDARRPKVVETEKEFAVAQDHLRQPWTIQDIEVAELVVDPLEAAPRLPFGHLNPAWQTFKQTVAEEDQLWSFSSPWKPDWGRDEVREGYVVLRGDAIGPYFLTRWNFVDTPGSD